MFCKYSHGLCRVWLCWYMLFKLFSVKTRLGVNDPKLNSMTFISLAMYVLLERPLLFAHWCESDKSDYQEVPQSSSPNTLDWEAHGLGNLFSSKHPSWKNFWWKIQLCNKALPKERKSKTGLKNSWWKNSVLLKSKHFCRNVSICRFYKNSLLISFQYSWNISFWEIQSILLHCQCSYVLLQSLSELTGWELPEDRNWLSIPLLFRYDQLKYSIPGKALSNLASQDFFSLVSSCLPVKKLFLISNINLPHRFGNIIEKFH